MTTPYTYLVVHLPTNQWYYGVRYSNGCHPSDLWKLYFTSSIRIRKLIEQDGPEVFRTHVRRTFTTAEEAIYWEHRVLKRVLNRQNCLNQNAFPAVSREANLRATAKLKMLGDDGLNHYQRNGLKWKEKKHQIDPITCKTFGELRRERFNATLDRNGTRTVLKNILVKALKQNNPSKRPEVRQKIATTLKAQVAAGTFPTTKGRKFPQISEKLKGNKATAGLVWYNDGSKDYRLLPSDEKTASLREGRLFSAVRGKRYDKVTCPHCQTVGSGGNMVRYHFDACKKRSPT